MDSEVIGSLVALIGSALGTFAGIVVNSKLTNYRIEQLEKKVDKHNDVIERTAELETWKESINLEMQEIKDNINTLLKLHMKG